MRFTQPMFKFIHAGETLAVLEAKNKSQARFRASLVSHLVTIPKNCKVKVLPRGAVCRGPVFFEGHFLAIEDALAEA